LEASGVEVRPYDPSDDGKISSMMVEIQEEFSEIFTAPDSKPVAKFVSEGGKVWVAHHNENVVGTIALALFSSKIVTLRRMFVAKNYRGKLSLRLLNTVIREAQKNKITDIYLGTMKQFAAAQRFYLKNGFTEIKKEELPDKMVLSSLDTLFFRLNLACDYK
jgi:GNAT superfamily N-acetyltransferase